MKNFLLFSMLLVFVSVSIAQTTFEATYDNGSEDYGTSVIALTDGYIMCGTTLDDANGDFDIFVTKVDLEGEVIWTNIYTSLSTDDDFATYINATSDEDFIITGNVKDPASGDEDVFVLKINSSGTELWSETYDGGTAEDDGANYIVETDDNTYLICGYSFDGTYSDMWVFEIDNDGTFIWENFFGLNGNDEATCVIVTDDDCLAIIGQSYDDTNGDLDGVLIKTDDNWDEDWIVYTTGTADEIFNDFIIDDDGDFLIVGAEEDETNGDMDLLLENISADGSTLYYSYTFDYLAGDDEAYRVYSDGTDYFLAGYVEDTDNNDVDAYIALIDVASGDILGDELYGDIFDDKFLDFDFASDNGFICIGFSKINADDDSDVYLVKTDENGEVPTDVISLSKNSDINIYPNPVVDFINIKTKLNFDNNSTYSIKNIAGQEIQSGVLNNSINVENIENGIYFIEISINNNLFTNKFIKF